MPTNLAHAPTGETVLHAQPYNIEAKGFYFSTAEEFTEKADKLRDRYGNPVEEFEIQYIDGDGDDYKLFAACRINQTNLDTWFDRVESLESHEKAALFYLMDCNGCTLESALDHLEDVSLYQGPLQEAATELFDCIYLDDVPATVRRYIDYEAFARDCELGGDLYEFRFAGSSWTVTNASGV